MFDPLGEPAHNRRKRKSLVKRRAILMFWREAERRFVVAAHNGGKMPTLHAEHNPSDDVE